VPAPLEIWGGVECTVCRNGDDYIDQVELTGHARRADDIDRIASLGVRTVRYPVLWERTAPRGIESADWAWPDARLRRLRDFGIEPVIGLMHHGSGPAHLSLADPAFPAALGEYAEACAERYPWMKLVTPVNEPLTTARFAGLYGHWFPHRADDRSFVRCLVNQCMAVRAAMTAIRRVAPQALLVQTEDLGHAHACEHLQYQAAFENERRWLTWDLLCGHVTPGHEMYEYLRRNLSSRRHLDDLASNPCPPDIIGIDYYVTSERYLDEDIDKYPEHCRGGNGRDVYADVEVARARPEERRGAASLIQETWHRYGIPIVVTEAHLSCDDECERVRWLAEIWNDAQIARSAGCDVRAVTAWALFGASGWDNLSKTRDGRYEAGAFDAGGDHADYPRESALADIIRGLATDGEYLSDVLDAPGWWQAAGTSREPAIASAAF
jgi:dTDP-4-dehydrorhamnose reductase